MIEKISSTREIRSALQMQGSEEDQEWLRNLYESPHPPSFTDFRSLPRYNNKRGTHHKIIGEIFGWLGNEMIPKDQGIHWMTIPITLFISLASIKIPANIDDPRNAMKTFPVKYSWTQQLDMVQKGKWRLLYQNVINWKKKCKQKGWHQMKIASQIDPSKIEFLAATGHLSRCVRALDSDGTTEPDIDDIISKHPGNEQINDTKA